jgi:hypothetical protein
MFYAQLTMDPHNACETRGYKYKLASLELFNIVVIKIAKHKALELLSRQYYFFTNVNFLTFGNHYKTPCQLCLTLKAILTITMQY